jgi:Transposase
VAIAIKAKFESAVTKANEEIFVRSYIENETTVIEFDTRKKNYKKIFNAKSKIKWDQETYSVDAKELSTLYCPIIYRFIIAKGNYYNYNGSRVFFTPQVEEVSMAQHVSKSVVRLSCFLAVNCGVTLRNIATIFTVLFLIPITKSSIKRWIDEIGNNLPSDEEMLKKLIEIKMPTECHIDGYYPMGTDNCVMVIKDEYDRILITHEAESESKEEAKKFLQKIKGLGINVMSAFSDYSKSFTEPIKEVFPAVKFQADHFHTVKNIWKHLKKSYLEFRRDIKGKVENYKSKRKKQEIEELAKILWDLRWTLLKKPCNLTEEETKKIKDLENMEKDGFIKNFRSILKNIVSIFDESKSESSAKAKLRRLRKKTNGMDNKHYNKIIKFFEDHWSEAMQYLKKDGTQKRSSNSESGMRLLRRLEKNHDGIRSEITRKYYIKIFQTIKYLSTNDIADFINNSVPDG